MFTNFNDVQINISNKFHWDDIYHVYIYTYTHIP